MAMGGTGLWRVHVVKGLGLWREHDFERRWVRIVVESAGLQMVQY